MKDQNKKVANLKHNQQMEKKKNAQLLEEVRRHEDNMTDNAQHLQVSFFIVIPYDDLTELCYSTFFYSILLHFLRFKKMW